MGLQLGGELRLKLAPGRPIYTLCSYKFSSLHHTGFDHSAARSVGLKHHRRTGQGRVF